MNSLIAGPGRVGPVSPRLGAVPAEGGRTRPAVAAKAADDSKEQVDG